MGAIRNRKKGGAAVPEGKPKTMLLTVEGKRVLFFHLPKTGGQSIYRAFGHPPQTHTRLTHEGRQQELAVADYAFAFIRHPLDRAVSFFRWVAGLHQDPKHGRRAEHVGLNILARHEEVNAFYRKFDFTYWEKVSFMLRPQAWMLHNLQGQVDQKVKLYTFEAFDTEFKRLCGDLGIPQERAPLLRHVNKSGVSQRWEDVLADDVIEKLCAYYAMDFEAFPFYENPLA